MVFFSYSLGIDFRSRNLIIILLRKFLGKIRMVDYRIYPVWSEGQKDVQEAQWISLISTFLSKNQVKTDRVCISIPREKALVRFLRLPAATKENLRKVIEYEAPKLTPFDKEEFFFDYQIVSEDAEWLNLIVAFVKKEDLNPYLNLLKKVGIHPVFVEVSPVSALNLFHYHQDKANGVSVLIDLNEPFLEMNILEGKDWKSNYHLPSPPDDKEGKILQVFRVSGVKDESLRAANLYVYGLDGTEKPLPSFSEFDGINGVYSPPTYRLAGKKDEMLPDYIYPSIGLPLRGLIPTRYTLNLLPFELRKKVREVGKPVFLGLLAVCIILAAILGSGMYNRYRNELEALRAEVKKKKPEVEAIQKLQNQVTEVYAQISEYDKMTRGAVREVDILKELAQALPPTVWIWQYKITGKDVEISGFADSASELIPLLDKSPLFEKVEFLAPVTKERERRLGADKERERFKIKMKLETGAAE